MFIITTILGSLQANQREKKIALVKKAESGRSTAIDNTPRGRTEKIATATLFIVHFLKLARLINRMLCYKIMQTESLLEVLGSLKFKAKVGQLCAFSHLWQPPSNK